MASSKRLSSLSALASNAFASLRRAFSPTFTLFSTQFLNSSSAEEDVPGFRFTYFHFPSHHSSNSSFKQKSSSVPTPAPLTLANIFFANASLPPQKYSENSLSLSFPRAFS